MTALLYPLGAKNIPRVVYFTSSKGLLPFKASRPVEDQGHGRARRLLHLHGNQARAFTPTAFDQVRSPGRGLLLYWVNHGDIRVIE